MHMENAYHRLVRMLDSRYPHFFPPGQEVPFALRTSDGLSRTFGDGEPQFAIVANNAQGVVALSTLDLTHIAEAYVHGALDLDGDLERAMLLRTAFSDRHPIAWLWRFVQPLLFGQVKRDRQWISRHYDYPPGFFLSFLDTRHHCYSQGIFANDEEPLEDAISRKLDFALEAVDAKAGDRVLDIGGGWGAMTAHAGRQGVHVTSITISKASEEHIRDLIEREQLPCDVQFDHLLEHTPAEPYDAIVNLGVTEHLPRYRATLRKYLELLKPGGKIYLDASAARVKHGQSAFLEKHIYPGNGSLLCLHEYLAEVARTPFQLRGVFDDRLNYSLTTRKWAENLDRNREEIERLWGPELFRKFRLYLWGCADAFSRDLTQAYRWVMQKPTTAVGYQADESRAGARPAGARPTFDARQAVLQQVISGVGDGRS